MTKITHLPDEVIVIILKDKSIDIKDIWSFKSTCKRLAQITLSNEFWKEKYCQRCSTAAKRYKKLKKTFNHLNIEEQVKSGIQCIKKLRQYVLLMLGENLSDTDKEQLNCLLYFIVENSIVYYFVWDELNTIISVELLDIKFNFDNWENRNYFDLIFFCLKQYRLLYKLFKFVNKPKEKQIVERRLLIIAQHFLPHMPYSVVNTWLDGITQKVLSRLKHKYPMHSIFSIPLEQFSFWGDNNISENFWNPTETSQIIRIVEEYIFSDLEIHKLYELLMMSNLEELNSIPGSYDRIVLIIIYHIVTRRFGIEDCILNVIVTHFQECYPRHDAEEELPMIWKPKYKIHWDVDEYLRMLEDSDLRCMLYINEDTHEFVITSQTFGNTLRQRKLDFCIYFDRFFYT